MSNDGSMEEQAWDDEDRDGDDGNKRRVAELRKR